MSSYFVLDIVLGIYIDYLTSSPQKSYDLTSQTKESLEKRKKRVNGKEKKCIEIMFSI